jgi:hypothetical protein
MSFVTALRDYVDLINATSDSLSGNLTLQEFLKQSFLYSLESLKLAMVSIFTAQWIRDLAFLPIKVPQLSLSIFQEAYIPSDYPFLNSFSFLETPFLLGNKFFIGFLNSFFACLPLSASHILSGRRLFVQGVPAGFVCGFGTLLGQFCFLTCVVFGIRPVVIPWVSFQQFSVLLTFVIFLSIVYTIAHQRSFQIVKTSERSTLVRFFLINFFLAWCEQSTFFQYLGNSNINASGSILESFFLSNSFSSLLVHLSYLFGFLIGGFFFTSFFIFGSLFLRDLWLKWTYTGMSRLIQRINFWSMTFLIAFCFSSLPFYGVDLLVGKPIGFIPQEKDLRGTLLWPNTVADFEWFLPPTRSVLSKQADVSPWDTGLYVYPNPSSVSSLEKQERDVGNITRKIGTEELNFQFQTIEELNYGGEYAWTSAEKRRGAPQRETVESFGKWIKDFFSSGEVVDEKTKKKVDKSKGYRLFSQKSEKQRNFSSREEGRNFYVASHSSQEDQDNIPTSSQTFSQYFVQGSESSEETNEITKKLATKVSESPIPKNKWISLFDWSIGENDLDDKKEESDSQTIGDSSGIKERAMEDIEVEEILFEPLTLSLSPFFQADITERQPIQALLTKRFYETSVFKNTLSFSIDSFLSRQPKTYLLSANDEIELLQKRQSLSKYYDTLRSYQKLKNFGFFEQFFGGSKSYATKFYNQQFKGTLKIIRRLFSLSLDPIQNPRQENPLTFDQPLFLEKNLKSMSLPLPSVSERKEEKTLAEELDPAPVPKTKVSEFTIPFFEEDQVATERFKNKNENRTSQMKTVLFSPFHEELFKFGNKNSIVGLDTSKETIEKVSTSKRGGKTIFKGQQAPFLEIANSRPLYAGWDDQCKKLVLTNRFLPRAQAGQELFPFEMKEIKVDDYPTLRSLFKSQGSFRDTKVSQFSKEILIARSGKTTVSELSIPNVGSFASEKEKERKNITFTTWPMSSNIFFTQKDPKLTGKKYNLMYAPEFSSLKDSIPLSLENEPEEETKWKMATMPINVGPLSPDATNFLWKVFPPNRGGFVWPGSDELKFNLQKFFKIS